jgi:hypothetical protein
VSEKKSPWEELPKAGPSDHTRQAAHFRTLAASTTTRRLKAQLLEEAERHERIAAGNEFDGSREALRD